MVRYNREGLILLTFLCCVALSSNAQWVSSSNGLAGGNIKSLASNGNFAFAGTNNGIYRSANNGASWTGVNTGLSSWVRSLATHGNTILAGTNYGIWRSTDNGTNWTFVNFPGGVVIISIVINGSNIFATTYDGDVFLSTNDGVNWSALNTGLPFPVYALEISGTRMYAATTKGLFVSLDNGINWSAVDISGGDTFSYSTLAINGSLICTGTWGQGLWLSTDNGTNWTRANFNSSGTKGFDISSLMISGGNIFAGTQYDGIFLSTDNGTSWTNANTGLTVKDILSLTTAGSNILAGTSGGVFLSTNNGASWTAANAGLTSPEVQSIVTNGNTLIAGIGGGVFLSANGGASWTSTNAGLTNTTVSTLLASGNTIFAGTSPPVGKFAYLTPLFVDSTGGVFVSTNSGANWTPVDSGLTMTSVTSLAMSGTDLFACTWGGDVFHSTNNGANWTAENTGPATPYGTSSIAISGGNTFRGTGGHGAFLSIDDGVSWTAINNGLTDSYISYLTVNGSNLFAATLSGLFLSTNNGASWTATGLTTAKFGNVNVSSLAFNGNMIFAGTSYGGVYLSTDNGTSWEAVNTGLTNNIEGFGFVYTLAVYDSRIFAGTSAGIWSRPLSDFTALPGASHAPVVIAPIESTNLNGELTIDLSQLISDADGNLDSTSLRVSVASGVPFVQNGFVLNLDYSGTNLAATDSLTVTICDLTSLCTTQEIAINFADDVTVFNGLSPNGDHLNDMFYIQYIDVLPEAKENRVSIFNRWGDVVFSVDNYNNKDRVFDGISTEGGKLPAGTYYYKIEFVSGLKSRSGFLEIRR